MLGSAEHRAVARQAVRESRVLLKNAGKVLPLKPTMNVLVAGDGADNIPKQNGGWTLSWQGTGTTNKNFPHADSIFAGIRSALTAGGGTATLSVDGTYKRKPDVAIVVFGEDPYAEFQGDVATLQYKPGDKSDLELLKRLRADKIPVVAVFLSGRPMWVNPELNASDAFVAAWLPGSEGSGIADVLFTKKDGSIPYDFKGKLPVYSFVVLVLVLAICMMLIVRRWSFQTAKVDDRGNVLPVLNIVDGIYTDIDRSPNFQGQLKAGLINRWVEKKLNLPPLLPAVTAARQDATTERDQMLDLATRGLPSEGKSEGRKQLAGQTIMKQVTDSNMVSRHEILDPQTSRLEVIDGVIVQELDSSWKEAQKK